MAVTTTIARHYAWRLTLMAVLCLVFAVWGAYDLWIKIPARQLRFDRYNEVLRENDQLESIKQSRGSLTPEQQQKAEKLSEELRTLAPGGKTPLKPGDYDRPTQWLFISCMLFVPYFLIELRRTVRRRYSMDDDGTLHLPAGAAPSTTWRPEDVTDIDMSRWMAKSVAHLVHADGTRVKLDDYKHRNLHLIVGAIASRLYPDQWMADARPVKPAEDETASDDGASPEPGLEIETAGSTGPVNPS